jgi:hypothetical protein
MVDLHTGGKWLWNLATRCTVLFEHSVACVGVVVCHSIMVVMSDVNVASTSIFSVGSSLVVAAARPEDGFEG